MNHRFFTALSLLSATFALSGCGESDQISTDKIVGAAANAAIAAAVQSSEAQIVQAEADAEAAAQAKADAEARKLQKMLAAIKSPQARLQTEIRAAKPERSDLGDGRSIIRIHQGGGSPGVPVARIAAVCPAFAMHYVSHSSVVSYDLSVTYADVLCRR